MRKPFLSGIAILALSLATVLVLGAQQPPSDTQPPYVQQQDPNAQPPDAAPANNQAPANGRQPLNEQQMDTGAGVARASFIHGDVSMQRGDNGEVSAVTLNSPLMTGDKISTGGDSRTELQLDFANMLRLDSNAQANLATLSRSRILIQLGQGLAGYSKLKGAEADVEIDTPNVAVHPTSEGLYRIEVTPDGDSLVTVREGEAEVSTPEGSTQVRKGQLITIHGAAGDAQYKVTDAPRDDDWDKWNRDRDSVIFNAQSYQHTNRYYTGAGDLDNNGTWSEVPDYGSVWIPTVAPGWAPYREGRWVYEPYYGWTWVAAEPWGWAPYHYGRWFVYGGSWAWWPGPAYVGYRPIWAPAYVSFFGFGGGVGVRLGFGFGSIGWLPIGPGDFFHPWWGGYRGFAPGFAPLRVGDRYSNLRNVYVNNRLREGISGVPAGSFGRGAVMTRAVSASEFRGGRAITGNLPVAGSRESMRVSDRPLSASAAARFGGQQRFFSSSRLSGAASGRVEQGGQSWQRFSSQPRREVNTRSAEGGYRSQPSTSRPPLDMSKPIVNQRTYAGSSAGGANNGYRGSSGAPTYRAAPDYRSAPDAPSGSSGSRSSHSSGPSRGGSSHSSSGHH